MRNTIKEEDAKKGWVCQTCGKSTHETDYDYLVHPKLHLGCAIEEEAKGKGIKKQYHEAAASMFKENKNQEHIRTLSEEIVDDKSKKYIYESPDGGETIYRREFQKPEREVVKDWQKKIGERKEMIEKANKRGKKHGD